jgi:hypothetical protein
VVLEMRLANTVVAPDIEIALAVIQCEIVFDQEGPIIKERMVVWA